MIMLQKDEPQMHSGFFCFIFLSFIFLSQVPCAIAQQVSPAESVKFMTVPPDAEVQLVAGEPLVRPLVLGDSVSAVLESGSPADGIRDGGR